MLKTTDSMKATRARAAKALEELLSQVPPITVECIDQEVQIADRQADIVARVLIGSRHHELVCEVKGSGQPRQVRMALLQLREYIGRNHPRSIPVFIAPYLSPQAQSLCREHDVAFLDLEGNCRLAFNGVFIERQVSSKPVGDRRELRSIFKPKSAQVLRVMLRDPRRCWRVAELSEAAGVSLGHISNIRAALLNREWASVRPEGLSLTNPDALLDAWRDAYATPAGERSRYYTTLHGSAFDAAAREALKLANERGEAMFASFSAAQWIAPYARAASQFFYADEAGAEALKEPLKLSSAAKGENIFITRPDDLGLFRDKIEPAEGIPCTSAIQTYLDLSIAGERGREAADYLREETLKWLN
jgi:Transcriptional regulator, AbiEi antitoxin, Type IV TA system